MNISSSFRPPVISSKQQLRSVRQHPLICYFLLTYGFSWLAWSPYVLSQSGLGLLPVRFPELLGILPGAYLGPLLSGFLMTAVTEGKAGVRHLLRRFILWRVGVPWYLFVLLGYPVIRVLGAAILPGVLATYRPGALASVPLLYLSLLPLTFLVSGLAEEPGWRGFALPRLQERYGPLRGTLILGLLWGGWHIPTFLTSFEGHVGASVLTVIGFIVGATCMALVITWVFNHTQGSLLIALLGHAALDAFTASYVFSSPLALDAHDFFYIIVGFGVTALLLILVTHGRLGYQRTLPLRDPASAVDAEQAL